MEKLINPLIAFKYSEYLIKLKDGEFTLANGVVVRHEKDLVGERVRVCYSKRVTGCNPCPEKESCPVASTVVKS